MANNYLDTAKQILSETKNCLEEKDWTMMTNQNGIILEKKEFADTCPCYRISTTIAKPHYELSNNIWQVDESKVMQNEPTVTLWKQLESGDDWKVCLQRNKMQWPIWPREVIFAQTRIEESDTIWLVAHSIEHPMNNLRESQYVTAQIHKSVFGFKDLGNGNTAIYRVAHIDPKGFIPQTFINMFAGNFCKLIESWKH